jgi:hypothetical protein
MAFGSLTRPGPALVVIGGWERPASSRSRFEPLPFKTRFSPVEKQPVNVGVGVVTVLSYIQEAS